MMGNTELFLLLFIILLLFGARKLPELAKGMGSAVKDIDAAKKLGIETEGRSIQEISEEIAKIVKTK